MTALLQIQNLSIRFGAVTVVDGVDLAINAGETLALVGESGCGKSVTALSILRLLPPPGAVSGGAIGWECKDLLKLPLPALNDLRGGDVAMIWQDPLAALNPVLPVGTPIVEALMRHRKLNRQAARVAAVETLKLVGIAQADKRMSDYPHQLSGGQRQRVMIAAAIACKPKLLIADEPTTALDVSVQAQILELLRGLTRDTGTALLLITHDLGVVAQIASRVAVMYAGQIVEQGTTAQIFAHPQHPYTQGLLLATPRLHGTAMPLPIPGTVPSAGRWPTGCRFKTRCPLYTQPTCDDMPPLLPVGDAQPARCWFAARRHGRKSRLTMREVDRIRIPVDGNTGSRRPPRTLCWHGDDLVDWAAGGTRYRMDGTIVPSRVYYPYRFDYAVASADGTYVALVERLGTKGLILKAGEIVREINRSYYHANAYDYPVAFATLPGGQPVLIHCPDEYCRLQIEDVESGQCLTQRHNEPEDYFYSRLSVSDNGRYLASAGWLWHPFDDIRVFDLHRALQDPAHLDGGRLDIARVGVTTNAVAFRSEDSLVLTTSDDYYDPDHVNGKAQSLLEPNRIAVYDVPSQTVVSQAPLEEAAGTLMALDAFAVGFYRHPKLIELSTGRIVARWEDLASGDQLSSIGHGNKQLPPLALDPAHSRFAVASPEEITVIQLG